MNSLAPATPSLVRFLRSAALLPSCYSGASQLVRCASLLSPLQPGLRSFAAFLFALPGSLFLGRTLDIFASIPFRLINSDTCMPGGTTRLAGRHPRPLLVLPPGSACGLPGCAKLRWGDASSFRRKPTQATGTFSTGCNQSRPRQKGILLKKIP